MREINVTCARIVKGVYDVYWERYFPYQIHDLINALNILIIIWGFQTSKAKQGTIFKRSFHAGSQAELDFYF